LKIENVETRNSITAHITAIATNFLVAAGAKGFSANSR